MFYNKDFNFSFNATCTQRIITEKLGKDTDCYHYQQSPRKSVPGQCAAMDYENMFYFSNEDCTQLKKPICIHKSIF